MTHVFFRYVTKQVVTQNKFGKAWESAGCQVAKHRQPYGCIMKLRHAYEALGNIFL